MQTVVLPQAVVERVQGRDKEERQNVRKERWEKVRERRGAEAEREICSLVLPV